MRGIVLHLEQQGALTELALKLGDQGLGVDCTMVRNLKQPNSSPFLPDPGLSEEDRAAVVRLDAQRGDQQSGD